MSFYLITYGQSLWIKVVFEYLNLDLDLNFKSINLKFLDSKFIIFKISSLDAFYR